jgi:membrane associated rhomboid family serine protease
VFPLKDNIPNERFPFVTVALIAINIVAYLLAIRQGGSFFGGPSDAVAVHYGAIPYELTHPGSHCDLVSTLTGQSVSCHAQVAIGVSGRAVSRPASWETIFTAMFMHGGFLHIAGNMLFLAIFGPKVEDAVGRWRFLLFYLLGGLVALGAEVLVQPSSTVPTIGASGAIAAVLGGYIVLYPRARVLSVVLILFLFTLVEIPALVLLGLWFLEQLYFGAAGLSDPIGGGGVAYVAHVGGFLFGLALIGLLVRRRQPTPQRRPLY